VREVPEKLAGTQVHDISRKNRATTLKFQWRQFMTIRVRTGLILTLALAIMGLASCDHYVCGSGALFGSSTCTAGTVGVSQNGGGSTSAAYAFVVDAGTSAGGTIDGYTLNTSASTFTATPSYTPPAIPGDDFGTGMVVAQSQYLYAGFGSTNQIYGWTVSSTGALTTIGGSPYAAAYMDTVGLGLGSVSVITNPAGTLLFFADTFQDKIYVYQIGSGGVLTAVTGSPFAVPFEPVNMTTDGLGNYLYVTEASSNHTGSEIGAYSIGAGSSLGVLAPVVGSPFVYPMWQVQGEPTGKYLIGTTGKNFDLNGADDDNLYVFAITQSGTDAGAIAPVSGSPFATAFSPFSIAVQPNTNGNLVYSFGLNDTLTGFNSTEGYAINASTGALTAVADSPFSNAALGTWGQFDQSGEFLFIFGGVYNLGTQVTTYQLSALDVGSGGALTQPTSTLSLTTGGVWAVTDPK
jgi:6-phosphogluconolactonase